MNEAISMVCKVSDPGQFAVPDDFLPGTIDIKGRIWDFRSSGIGEQGIDEWLNEKTPFVDSNTTMIMVGDAGTGKSELAAAIARELSHRHGFEKLCSSTGSAVSPSQGGVDSAISSSRPSWRRSRFVTRR